MSVHRIRLAGPWDWQPLSVTLDDGSGSESLKCQLPFPAEHSLVAQHGIALSRRFHCPTGIDASTSVAVTVEVQHCIPELWLNDRILTRVQDGAIPKTLRFDVSGFLKPFNELQVRLVPIHSDLRPRLNSASLEIRESE